MVTHPLQLQEEPAKNNIEKSRAYRPHIVKEIEKLTNLSVIFPFVMFRIMGTPPGRVSITISKRIK